MELSPSDKGRIEHQFDSFCKLVLVCEMKDYKKMILRKMAKEILFSELILIYGYDLEHKKVGQEEIKDIFSIKVMGFDITIKNMLIAEAVLSLTEKGRNIVLMSFFLGMTDKEIGKMLHLGQSTVNYHKNNNLKKMRKFMEDAINLVFAHYESYIRKLSLRPYTDEFGMTQFFVDYELKNRLETKLLEKILDFEAV